MKLSERIRQACKDHRKAYPDGDFRAVNDRLSALFDEAYPILIANRVDPWEGGNEGRASALEIIESKERS